MKKKFEYEQTTKIIFGSGCIKELPVWQQALEIKSFWLPAKKNSCQGKVI